MWAQRPLLLRRSSPREIRFPIKCSKKLCSSGTPYHRLGYKERLNYNWKQIFNTANQKYDSSINDLQFPTDYDKESFLRSYIQEIWLSELHPPTAVDTGKLIDYVVSNDKERKTKFEEELKKMCPNIHNSERWWHELDNLYDAVQFVLKKEHETRPLSETFIKEVHNRVGYEIVDSHGQYREGYVGTFGSVIYAPPQVVPSKLSDLVSFVNTTLQGLKNNDKDNRIYAICLAGYFLSEFLLIHPFCDGNGRTARLLVSHLIREYTVVPLSLFPQRSPRSAYINALEAEGRVNIPWAVIDFVMECAKTTCKIAVWHKS